MFTGYSNSGASEYTVGSQRGIDFINDAPSGSSIVGGDGSTWTKNADGTTSISRGSDSWTVGSALGNLQNSLDTITAQSDKTSARSNDYAREASEWSASQAAIANEFNAYEAQKNRDWQTLMSNTAHQREVRDLKAAGLNPVLSALGGNGASTTSGATASAVMPQSHSGESSNPSGAIASILSSMLAAQTSLTNQAVSARTQEAIADKTNAMSQLVAELYNATSRENARLSAETGRYSADSSASASRYASDNARAASRYSADSSSSASRYASDNARAASRYSADSARAASMFSAETAASASRYASDRNYETHRDFPSSVFGAAGSIGQYIGSTFGDPITAVGDVINDLFSGKKRGSDGFNKFKR